VKYFIILWCRGLFKLPLIRQKRQSQEAIASATSFSDTRVLTLLPDDMSQQFLTPIQRWKQSVQVSTNVLDLFTSLSDAENQEKPFHIAIVDQVLLGMPPEQFIESLRHKDVLAHTGFILVGEFFDKTSIHSFIDGGYADVLTYPLNESLLFNAIHEICIGKSLQNHDIPSIAQQHQKREQQVNLNILVAEDNEVNQVVIREFLELMGHDVTMVEDGEQALDALDAPAQSFDLALLDINMPHMSGLDVLKAYRFLEGGAHLPMIVLSADAISSNIDECLEAGADAYLTKPIAYHKLAQAIDKIIPIEKKLSPKQAPTPSSSADVKWKYIDSEPLDGLSHISKKEHFVEGLIEKFILRVEENIGSLITAQEQVDAQTYIEIIHALKGASGMVGAVAIQHACEDIELLMKKVSSPVKVSIVELQCVVQESIQELARYVEKRSAQTQKNTLKD